MDLPGAGAMQPDSLASLISLACKRGHLHFVQRIIREVPAVQQLPSRALCEALAAGAADTQQRHRQLVRELAGLQAAQQLAAGDAAWLLQQLLVSLSNGRMIDVLEDLEPMQLGSQLTGGEMLQLLRAAVKCGSDGAVGDIVQLTPAAHEIDDIEGYAAFLQEAMRSNIEYNVIDRAAQELPVTQQLPVEAVLDLCLQGIKGVICLLELLFELPAVSRFSTAAIEQLLQAVLQQQSNSSDRR